MAGSIRCGVAFHSLGEFRAGFAATGPACFVPYPDEVAPGDTLEVDVTVAEARLELRGEVMGPDFDEQGNVGLKVLLDAPSWKIVQQFTADLAQGTESSAVFATARPSLAPTITAAPPMAAAPELERADRLTPGIVVDGRFRIEGHLATGGMGEVYRAEHVHLKRPLALKLLRRVFSAEPEMWRRFEREAQLVSKLENPHVVRIFDFGKTADGQLFLAMEFVEGETLADRLKKGPLAPADAVEILAQVLDGLNEAHGLGVVHRDLKPPNIMLGHRRDGGERAKILDFGIARLTDALAPEQSGRLTQLGLVMGTPAYLAPEQALADEVDHRTDIYALGCVAYELLTGRPPFVGTELRKVIAQHLTSAPIDPAKLRPELERLPRLCAAVLKALSKEREHRFQNVLEFREALRLSLQAPGQPAVSLDALVPQPSAPWPPPDWAPAPAPAPVPPPAAPLAVSGEANDFFASMGSGVFASDGAAPAAPAEEDFSSPQLAGEGQFLRLEVLGAAPRSPAALACTAKLQDLITAAGGLIASRDEEGVTFGFLGKGGYPSGRVTKAMLVAREAVALEGVRLKVTASVRGLAGLATFPLTQSAAGKLRRQLATARANNLWIEQALSGPASRLCDLSAAPIAGLVACTNPLRRARNAPDLLGRKALTETFERRLSSLQQGVVAPLLITGPSGSGHSALASQLLALVGRRAPLALSTSGLLEPYGALVELLCAAVGVHPSERMTRLAAALEPLPVIDSARLAALGLAGVRPLPAAMTPGQAAHALRVVLRGVAIERPLVLAFDGLHQMDEGSVDAFVAMASRPASRELIVGLTAPSPHDAKLAFLQPVPIPPLAPAETQRLLSLALGAVAGDDLGQYVQTYGRGLPRQSLQLLSWLDDGGLLVGGDGTVDLSEPGIGPPPGGPAAAALEALPSDTRLVLQTAATLGARFDQVVLREVCPAAIPQMLTSLQAAGWLVTQSPRRGRFSSQESLAALPPLSPSATQGVHLAAAQVLIARGQVDAASVDPVQLAAHLTSAGDGARAAPLWKHALDQALARRDPRGASRAWAGVAAAVGLMPASEAQARTQVDAVARAAAQSLVVEDTPRARALLDAIAERAAALPAPSAEFLLLEARVLRLEGRRVKAVEVLCAAEQAAGPGPVLALVLAERGEGLEVEGDLEGAAKALEEARKRAAASADLARWHGEVELSGRLEARLATITFARRDVGKALALLEGSLLKWRAARWPFAEARVLATMGTVLAYQQRFPEAAAAYQAASAAGGSCGDLRFQARALLQQAKAVRKQQGDSAAMKKVALEARKLAVALGWEEGRLDASALLGQ